MDDCPISFGPRAVLPLNPGFVSGAWETNPPGISLELTFDTVMNQSSLPADASWELKIDGTPIALQDPSWTSSTVLRYDTATTSDPSAALTIELLVQDDGLHSLSGMRNVLPFGPSDIFVPL